MTPQSTQEALGPLAGDELSVLVKPDRIVMMPEPKQLAERTAGFHRDVWQGTDAYLEDERNSW